MISKCSGCGVKVQTNDPEKRGYIRSEVYLKNVDNFYCERCFNLIHYNRKIEVEYSEAEFLDNVKKISKTKALIINIVDIYDLEGTYIKDINKFFPNNKIYLVANKFDLFLKSVNKMRVKNYLMDFLDSKKLEFDKTIIMSSFNDEDIAYLYKQICNFQKEFNEDVYIFGVTNVGKSTVINALIKLIGNDSRNPITVSNSISTTLDLIKIPSSKGRFIYDTPGILNLGQASFYLDKESLALLSPKKYIKPKIYQLNPKQALFLGGFAIFEFLKGERSSFVVNMPSNLVVHRTKLENASEFYDLHKDDILKLPNQNEREKLGTFKTHIFRFDNEKIDISISGLGFVTVAGSGELRVKCFEKISVSSREAII